MDACQSKLPEIIPETPPLPQRVEKTSDQQKIALANKLIQQGVKIINTGQRYMLVIPSVLLFADQSPKLEWAAYNLLNDVACYLQQFRIISVHINSFSTCYGSARRAHALTLARARYIGNYLESQGVDTRFIFTQGIGSDKPIIMHAKPGEASLNSRIEITFSDAVA